MPPPLYRLKQAVREDLRTGDSITARPAALSTVERFADFHLLQPALQLLLQFGVAEPGEDAACAVETHIFETMVSVALFTPATYTVRTPYIRIKATAG